MPPACKQQTLLLVFAFAGLLIASCTKVGDNSTRASQSAVTEKDEDGRRNVKEKDCECPDQAIACAGKDCKTFCSCSQGSCTEQSCPPGTLFNTAIGSCDAVSNVACGKQAKPTPAPKLSPTPIPSPTQGPVTSNPVATPANTPALTVAPTPALTNVPPAPAPVTPATTAGMQTPSPSTSTATPVPTTVAPIPTTFAPTLPPVSPPSGTIDPILTPSMIPTEAPTAIVTPTPSPVSTPVPSSTAPAQNLTAVTAQNASLTATNASSAPPPNTTVNANTAVNASLNSNGTSTVFLPNQVLGPAPPTAKDSGSQTGVIIAVVVVVIVVAALLALGISVWCCCGQRFAAACWGVRRGAPFKKAHNHRLGGPSGSHLPLTSAPAGQSNPGFGNSTSVGPVVNSPLPGQNFSRVYPFSFRELQQATSNFSEARLLGEGGFGMVYYGRLANGRAVAVKRATTGRKETEEQFKNEVDFLSRVHHRHLVELLGFCQENGEQMLVYELMAQGPLSSHLYGTGDPLSWQQRMKVALGAARGLEYLHVGADPAIVHRDIKTDNLLLDSDFDAKVADFGLSRLPSSQSYSVSVEEMPSAIKGTLGYLDPDYVTGNPITTKSDVYSFGVVLIQLVSGRPAVDFQAERDCRSVVDWAKPFLRAQNYGPLMDPRLHGRFSRDVFSQLCGLAARCVERNPLRRPAMTDVVRVLEVLEGKASQIAEFDHGAIEIRSGSQGGGCGTSSGSGFVERSGGDQRLDSGFGNGSDGVHGLGSSGSSKQSGFLWSRPPSSNSTVGHRDMDSYSGNLGELTMSEVFGR